MFKADMALCPTHNSWSVNAVESIKQLINGILYKQEGKANINRGLKRLDEKTYL